MSSFSSSLRPERSRSIGGRFAFTLVELLVVMLIIGMLAGLLLPAVSAARASARMSACARQLGQVGAALTRADMARVTATPSQWTTYLGPFLDDALKVLHCPDDLTSPTSISYGLNSRASRMMSGDSGKIVLLDYTLPVATLVGTSGTDPWPASLAARHRGQVNVLSCDGSVHPHLPADIDPTVCASYELYWRPMRDIALEKPGCQ